MTTINMPILGTYTEVEGQVFSNPNMVSIEYVIVHDSDGIPPESLKGSFIRHREQEDLREYINPGVKFYFRMENKRPSIITVMKDIPDANLTQGSSSGKELIVTTYSVKTAFVGASLGDTVTQTQVIDVSSSNPTTTGVIWRNQTTNTDLLSTPLASNLSLLGVGALGNSTKPTYRAAFGDLRPTSANYRIASLEAGPSKCIRLKKLTIWNPGMFTTAQISYIEIARTTAVSSGGIIRIPSPTGIGDPVFSGKCRYGGHTITYGETLWTGMVYTPTTIQPFVALQIDFTNGNTMKGIEIPAGVTNGIALIHNTGAAGGAGLAFTMEFTEE